MIFVFNMVDVGIYLCEAQAMEPAVFESFTKRASVLVQ